MQATGHHQVQDRVKFAVEVEDHSLADPRNVHTRSPIELGDRRVDSAQDEGVEELKPRQRPPEHALTNRVDVGLDLREFRH
jgi:hypothetical protein